jgi:hypothetical protein
MSEETSTSNSEREAALGSIEERSGVSDAQLAARRENAKKSTGPRTFAGKIRSSRNALKHGRYCGQTTFYSRALYGRMQELGEDPGEFADIGDGLRTSYLPSNKAQQMFVHEIAFTRMAAAAGWSGSPQR